VLAVAAWLGRDLPRRLVEKQLAKAFGGEVRLAALEWPRKIPTGKLFVLRGLEVETPVASPAIRRVTIEIVEARASWRQILDGKVDDLVLRGLYAQVDPTLPPFAPGESAGPPFATLEVAEGAAADLVYAATGRNLAGIGGLRARVANQPGFPGSFAATLFGLDLADLEVVLPLDLPPAVRRQLEDLSLHEVAIGGESSAAGLDLVANAAAWQEAGFKLRGENLEARLEGLDLAALSSPGAPVEASGKVDLAVTGSLKAGRVELIATPSKFKFEGQETELGDTRLAAGFERGEAGVKLKVEALATELLASGMLPVEAKPLLPVALEWQGEVELGRRLARGSGKLASRKLGEFPFEGEFSAADGLDLEVSTPRLAVARLLEPLPPPKPGEFRPAAKGTISAVAKVEGQPQEVAVTAALKFADLEPIEQVTALTGDSRLRWSATRPLAVSVDSLAGKGRARLPIEGLAPQEVDIRLRGAADIERGFFELPELSLATKTLGKLAGDLKLELPPGKGLAAASAAGKVELSEVAVARWLDVLGPAYRPAAMQLGGDFAASATVSKIAGGPWALGGKWSLQKAGFASTGGDRVLEGLGLEGDFAAEAAAGLADGSAYELRAGGQGSGFQLLWGTFFGDFSAARPRLAAHAKGKLGQEPSLAAEILASPGFEIDAALEPGRRYSVAVLAEDLEAVRRAWLLPLFGEQAPRRLAGRLDLEAEGALPVEAGGAFTTRGRLQLRSGELEQATLLAQGIELDLPFDLRAKGGAYSGPRLSGSFAARRLAFGRFEIPPLHSRLWVEADAAGLEEALEASFAGGKVRLEKVAAGQVFAESPRLEAAVFFDGISLAELSAGAGLPIEGRIDGGLPRLTVQGQRLEVEGGGKIALFGGEVEVGDISGRDVFSAYPRLRLSAKFREIDLGQITRRFDFGEMHGIVEGEIENFELFRNVPLSFKARVVSVERKGVKQTVDVKAVQNLTILGTGASTNVLDRGLQRFFKRYNYAALGVSAQLGNDVLLLRGLEQRDGKELFLRGRLPFSIDIVNAQPGKTVSFLAMVRRLKSLNLGQAKIGK
jgi:hypothetical protein